MKKTLSVSAIHNGTVIDHITAGQALVLVKLLKLSELPNQTTLGLNLNSALMGLKDIIKISDRYLSEKEAADIAIFAPHATLNIIEDYAVIKKIKASLPDIVNDILICPNSHCITKQENVSSRFYVINFKNRVHLKCHYCEKLFHQHEMTEYRT